MRCGSGGLGGAGGDDEGQQHPQHAQGRRIDEEGDVAGAQGLFDQQAAKPRAVDEEIGVQTKIPVDPARTLP